jgi:hypothetical protein
MGKWALRQRAATKCTFGKHEHEEREEVLISSHKRTSIKLLTLRCYIELYEARLTYILHFISNISLLLNRAQFWSNIFKVSTSSSEAMSQLTLHESLLTVLVVLPSAPMRLENTTHRNRTSSYLVRLSFT